MQFRRAKAPEIPEGTPDLLAAFSLRYHRTGINDRGDRFFSEFDQARNELRHLLDQASVEERVQKFLEKWPILLVHAGLDGFYRVASARSALFAKVHFGREFQLDFAYCSGSSAGTSWTFIELERPDAPLFTKAGDPSKELSHALRQVLDWHSWSTDHPEYARHVLGDLIRSSPMQWGWPDDFWRPPRSLIVIGRRSELTRQTNRRRAQMSAQNPWLEIITYDRIIDPYVDRSAQQGGDGATIGEASC